MSTHQGVAAQASVSDERYRLLVQSVVDYAIFMLDPNGFVQSWNPGAERIKGFSASEVVGKHFSMFYTQQARETHWPDYELQQANATGRFEDEGWRVRKDGSTFWANVVITALREPDGSLAGFAKVTRDLTERRGYEQSLRESEERFRLLLESVSGYAIFMLSPTGVIESWNVGAQQLKGYTATEALGRHFSIFYLPEDLERHLPEQELKTAVALGRAEEEGWRVRKDGSVFWANVVISPVYDAERRHRGFAKVTRDMSDRRKLEELQNAGKRMSEFLAMLAHELRNPLAPIRNAVTVLQLEPAPSPVVRNSRDMIDRQLTHMSRLVDDLLDVGRITTGKIQLKTERFLYDQVVARAAEAVRPLMDARQQRFVLNLLGDAVHVRADPTRLTQVLQNLLTNAAKYTPAKGQIELTAWVDGNQLCTSVQDNGVGLTRAAMQTIFELFSQGEASGGSKEGGLGIGLTLAKSLVEMHGGALKVESGGLGKGSTFSFFIPGAVDEPPEDGAEDVDAMRILVVDDNRDAADSLAEVLRLLGYTVRTTYDGASALEAMLHFRPELVLADLGMPTMDGFELASQLRALPYGNRLVIAAVTGYGTAEDRLRTEAAGFDAHLVKPLDLETTRSFLERAGQLLETKAREHPPRD
ncbi:MAG: PAS domain S-box protein [Burkholderiaceae bacterium]